MSRRTLLSFFALAAFALSGCATHSTAGTSANATAVPTAVPTALPEVSAPPAGVPVKPSWITELAPQGTAAVGAQIRVRFAEDIVPVEMLEAPDRQTALAKIEIAPALPGRFIFVTPRMVTFEAEKPVPKASRIVVTVRAGLKDLKGNTLDHDITYGFTTEAATIAVTATASDAPQGPRPRFGLTSNVRLDEASLLAHAALHAEDGSTIPLVVVHDASPSPSPDAEATPESSSSFDNEPAGGYTLEPDHDLPLAKSYSIAVSPGIRPLLGNLPSLAAATGVVRTYAPLAFSGVTLDTSVSGRPLDSGNPSVNFNNPLAKDTALAAISLTPAAKTGFTPFALRDGGTTVDINPAALRPLTKYTVTVAAGLKDAFGQTLGSAATGQFTTGSLASDLWAPSGFSIFPSTASVSLDVETANLPEDRYRERLRPLQPADVIGRDLTDPADVDALLADDKTWPAIAAPATRDAEATTRVPLAPSFGGPTGLLAYGVADSWTQPGVQATTTHLSGAVQVTNVGVFAQWFPTGGFVRANHLSDGGPIANAIVEIFGGNAANADGPPLPCASGRTGADGTAEFTQNGFARCLSVATQADQAPTLIAIVYDGTDWSFVRTSPYDGSLGDSYESWSAGVPHSRGTFISDRSLYQRGETASFTGVGYFETAGAIVRGSSKTFAVTLKSPKGTVIDLGSHALDEFGDFTLQTTLAANADLGDWTIVATGTGGETFQSTFTVAQFRPPNFKVSLAVDRPIAVPGETVTATTTSSYLFGAPVAGGKEHVTVQRHESTFTPKGFEDFNFGPLYLYPDEPPTLSNDVTQADVVTGADGTTTVPIPIATDLPFAADYEVDGETKDVSNLAVSDSKTFTVLPSRNLIALRGGYLAQESTSFPFDFTVVDPTGAAVPSQAVHFTLARRVFDVSTQLVEGGETDRPAAHYETVSQFDATSTGAVQSLKVMTGKAGEYRLRANFTGASGDATATDLEVYVAGADADWYRPGDTTLSVKLDKKQYHAGDTATAIVASPYADAEMYFAIIRNKTISKRIVRVHGATVQMPFAITSDMLPNVAVEAVLVRTGPSLASGVPAGLKDLSREGFADVSVALDSKYVRVAIAPRSEKVAPGSSQQVTFHVTDAGGAPVVAELTVAVANDAVLQLSGYRFPDLTKTIYAEEPISTRYADNRQNVKLESEHKYVEKGFGYGGGAMAGPAGTRVRTNFKPSAFFDGSVRTNASGDATVTFTLPDDLTTWRVLATALTRDARFGSADATFVAQTPLVTNAILPQFARPGDTLQGGVSVTNVSAFANANDAHDVDVEGSLRGPLGFVDPAGTAVSKKTNFEGPTAGYRFAMAVGDAGRSTPDAEVTFKTALGSATDAFTVRLPIVSDDVLESVVDTGTTQGTASVPLTIDAALAPGLGGLHVTLASTLLGDTLAPVDAALAGDANPFGFEAGARIGIAADRILLERHYGRTADVPGLQATIGRERDALRPLAREDGSYAFYPQGPSDAFTSAFVAIQLLQARDAGADVGGDLAHLHTYLLAVLADPAQGRACDDLCIQETRLEMLETLAPMGDLRSDHLSEIDAEQTKMSFYERVELARLLVKLPEWHDRGIALRDKLLEQLYETGRRAGLVVENDFGETPVDGQAQLLSLMIETGVTGDRVDRAFTSLLQDRGRDGTWGCACDDAEAMNAVVLYANRDKTPPNFTATAGFGSTTFSQKFAGYDVTQVTKDVPMASLPRGKTNLSLARTGTGTLHYTVDLDYAVRGPAAGAYQGIRIDRIVRPAGGNAEPVVSFGLAPPAGPVTIAAGNVYDIEDRITTDHPLEGVVVTDSLPAGLEAIDTRFQTNSAERFESVADWTIDYQTIERSRVVTFASGLQPGVYAFHYLARSVTLGDFAWPAARASLALAPDEFGRTSAGTVVVTDK